MTRSRMFLLFILAVSLMAAPGQALAQCTEPAMADYTSYPVFQANAVAPNIMILLDNSGSMNEKAYSAGYDHNIRYYGYFEPHRKYTYSSGVFYRDANGQWDGNFLNWITMRKVDVTRKVLMGGKATSRTGGGNQTNIGEAPGSAHDYAQSLFLDQWNVMPGYTWDHYNPVVGWWEPGLGLFYNFTVSTGSFSYSYSFYTYNPSTGIFTIQNRSAGPFTIRVKKGEDINNVPVTDEGANFLDGNLAGIMQRLWGKGRFGLEVFNLGNDDKPRQNGGLIPRVIGSSMTDMINSIQNQASEANTPLAESYYTAIKYFMQEDMESAMDQANAVIPNQTAAQDPYNNPDPIHCAKSFVLLLTDGASSKDLYVPDRLKDFDGDGNEGFTLVDSGTTPEGRLVYTTDTTKTFYLNYIDGYAAGATEFSTGASPYPSGSTPFTTAYIGKKLVLYDREDNQIFFGDITGVNTGYDDWDGVTGSGTSEIVVSGTTNTPEWASGASPYNYDLSWKIVDATPNSEVGINGGSDYLDDLALYARTVDLRDDLSGDQNLILYTVYAFGNDVTARNLLRDASMNGGFDDKNGNRRPDLASEWDNDSDNVPDTYYEASNGYLLESQLIKAINDILRRAAAGTAVSVLATSGEGEGNLVQAYFRPSVASGVTDVTWVGYLQSLWVDANGNLREDTDQDLGLDLGTDKVIVYFLDTVDGNAKIKRFDVSNEDPYPDVENDPYQVVPLEGILPLWEAGSLLSQRNLSTHPRKIFTYLDKDKDGVVDEPTGDDDPFDDDGEMVRFHASGVSEIMPYLGVRDDTTWGYLGFTQRDRTLNLIEYIGGNESGFSGTSTMAVRSRTIEGNVWRLGDIVHSTPVSISRPPDNYHVIYSDESYQTYLSGVSNRETVVYVGANDGMLHAFTSWVYDSSTKQYSAPSAAPTGENIGDEIWGYIPQALLPHLKWFPAHDYTHVYYVDLKPKIFDAKILPDDTHYADDDSDDNWGTILLAGLNYGGKEICVEDWFDNGSGTGVYETRTFTPTFTCIDVTNPRHPRVLWERSYQGLGMTTSTPAVVKVQDKWYAIFGSGPTDYDGTSDQQARAYVVDLKTGDAVPNLTAFSSGTTNAWLFEAPEAAAFMNSPVSLDKELNYNVDAIYFGETYYSGSWKGKVYKISVPWDWSDPSTYVDNPNDATNPWTFTEFFDAARPVTASLTPSIDFFDNVWVYFGTGRYISQEDKTNNAAQFLFGVVDPFFNSFYDDPAEGDYYHNYSAYLPLNSTNLFSADDIQVTTDGLVFDSGVPISPGGTWDDLLAAARAEDGWYRTLTENRERNVTKFTVFGGIAFAPTFIPNEDVCGFGGNSNLYGVYFETGTAFYDAVLPDGTTIVTLGGEQREVVDFKMSLGAGKSSALGIHVGAEEGAKAFIQQSTGTVLEAHVNPAFNIKSGLINWRQR